MCSSNNKVEEEVVEQEGEEDTRCRDRLGHLMIIPWAPTLPGRSHRDRSCRQTAAWRSWAPPELEEEEVVAEEGAAKDSVQTLKTSLHMKRPKCSRNIFGATAPLLNLNSRITRPSSLLYKRLWAPPSMSQGWTAPRCALRGAPRCSELAAWGRSTRTMGWRTWSKDTFGRLVSDLCSSHWPPVAWKLTLLSLAPHFLPSCPLQGQLVTYTRRSIVAHLLTTHSKVWVLLPSSRSREAIFTRSKEEGNTRGKCLMSDTNPHQSTARSGKEHALTQL